MTTIPFAYSISRLERAMELMEGLRQAERTYLASEPVTVRLTIAEEYDEINISWIGVGPRAGMIFGDAVHSARTALDLLAAELARMRGKSDSDIFFPFGANAELLEVAISKRFAKAGPVAAELVRKIPQEKLRALHDLDIRDKHRQIIFGQQSLYVDLTRFDPARGIFEYKPDMTQQASIWTMEKELPGAGLGVIEFLDDLIKEVDKVIFAFAETFNNGPVARA